MERRQRNFLRASRNRNKAAEIKVIRGCTDCGYNENPFALEFDHRENTGEPYSGKSRTVASLMYGGWESILVEIEKCDVVCANCHAIRTFERRKIKRQGVSVPC